MPRRLPSLRHRKIFVLRVWQAGGKTPEWIGEIQNVQNGETQHISGLEALFELLRQKIVAQDDESPAPEQSPKE